MNLCTAKELALKLMAEHGIDREWHFKFDRSKRRFGNCNWTHKRISLSMWLTEHNEEHEVKDTILHEIAHALAGHSAGHGYAWKKQARSIGCTATRCYSKERVITAPGTFRGTCPTCNRTVERHKRNRIACGKCCGGRFNAQHLFVWERI